jgi:membrane protein
MHLPQPIKGIDNFLRPTIRYWLETEVHVYCFAVAANVLLSVIPFVVVMLTVTKHLFHWNAAAQAIYTALDDFFPSDVVSFIKTSRFVRVPAEGTGFSVLLLLLTANGIFEPLEVALNRAWGVAKNRSYLRNQMVSLGLIFACGTLGLISSAATALNEEYLASFFGLTEHSERLTSMMAFKIAAFPLSILMLFLVYWLLPNRKMPVRRVLPAAVVIGVFLELLKYVNLFLWPIVHRNFLDEYGPFVFSVTIVIFSFVASMLVLAGGEWASRPYRKEADPVKQAAQFADARE